MQILLKGYFFGLDSGPEFELLADNGSEVFPSIVTKSQIFNGIYLTVNNSVNFINILSLGVCNNMYELYIDRQCSNILLTEDGSAFQTQNGLLIESDI
jgi:hypothetical protein